MNASSPAAGSAVRRRCCRSPAARRRGSGGAPSRGCGRSGWRRRARFSRQLRQHRIEDGGEFIDQRCGLLLADQAPPIGGQPTADAFQHVLGHRRTGGLMHVVELAPDVRPGGRPAIGTGSDLRFRVIVLDDLVGAAADFAAVVGPDALAPVAVATGLRATAGGTARCGSGRSLGRHARLEHLLVEERAAPSPSGRAAMS